MPRWPNNCRHDEELALGPSGRRRSIEEHHHQVTMAEEMAPLIDARIRGEIYAAAGIYGILKNDADAEDGYVPLPDPWCHHRALRNVPQENKGSPDESQWQCFECGRILSQI